VWASVADQSTDTLIAIDGELRITACNPAAQALSARLLGVRLEPGLQAAEPFAARARWPSGWSSTGSGRSGRAVHAVEGRAVPEGGELLMEWHFQPLRAPGGEVRGAFCTGRDVGHHGRPGATWTR